MVEDANFLAALFSLPTKGRQLTSARVDPVPLLEAQKLSTKAVAIQLTNIRAWQICHSSVNPCFCARYHA